MPKSLTAADGAVFRAEIEEMPDGMWRASGVIRLDKKSEVLEQPFDIKKFPSEKDARDWVDRAGKRHGFKSCKLKVTRQPSQMA